VTFTDDAALERRCRDRAAAIAVPRPFSLPALVQGVAAGLGRPIRLEPLPEHYGAAVSGECQVSEEGLTLRYPPRAGAWYALTAVAHEIGHIVSGHLTEPGATVRTRAVDALLPDLQEAHRQWGLYRCSLADGQELEAELVASFLVHRIEEDARRPEPPSAPVARRFTQMLGGRRP